MKHIVKFYIECQIAVSKPWVDEILRIEGRIRAQRMQMQEFGMPADMIALTYAADAWDFKIPEYDLAEHFWSTDIKGWVEA